MNLVDKILAGFVLHPVKACLDAEDCECDRLNHIIEAIAYVRDVVKTNDRFRPGNVVIIVMLRLRMMLWRIAVKAAARELLASRSEP